METPQERGKEIAEIEEFRLARIKSYLEEYLGDGPYVIKKEVFVARIYRYTTPQQFEKIMDRLGIKWRDLDLSGYIRVDEEQW